MKETYLELLEQAYYEITFAFEGLADENVWKRPAEGLLSVGELAGHIAYWEAVKFAGDGTGQDLTKCAIHSPLIDPRLRYYPTLLETSSSDMQKAMTAQQVCDELQRVHREAMERFKAAGLDVDTPVPGSPWEQTYGDLLKYASFHAAYHTGQMYSARHLLGEATTDN